MNGPGRSPNDPRETVTPSPRADCILHLGMPKTGTSSIQDSLFLGLDDPRFQFVSLGYSNAGPVLAAVFATRPEQFWLFREKGLSGSRFRRVRLAHEVRLRRALRRARSRSITPILSAETSWRMDPSELGRIRDFLAQEGFAARVVVYLRPIKSWLESQFQQNLKWQPTGGGFGWPSPQSREAIFGAGPGAAPGPCDYVRKLEGLERVFGRSRLTVRPFVRRELAGGCAVRDFCAVAGIDLDPRSIVRTNESLGADACRILNAYDLFARAGANPSVADVTLLVECLAEFEDAPFRFHSEVVAPFADEIESQIAAVRARFGVDLAEDLRAADDGPCLRSESDLLRFSREALDQLAALTGAGRIEAGEGEGVARDVARSMEPLRRLLPMSRRVGRFRAQVRRALRWLRRGD